MGRADQGKWRERGVILGRPAGHARVILFQLDLALDLV